MDHPRGVYDNISRTNNIQFLQSMDGLRLLGFWRDAVFQENKAYNLTRHYLPMIEDDGVNSEI